MRCLEDHHMLMTNRLWYKSNMPETQSVWGCRSGGRGGCPGPEVHALWRATWALPPHQSSSVSTAQGQLL